MVLPSIMPNKWRISQFIGVKLVYDPFQRSCKLVFQLTDYYNVHFRILIETYCIVVLRLFVNTLMLISMRENADKSVFPSFKNLHMQLEISFDVLHEEVTLSKYIEPSSSKIVTCYFFITLWYMCLSLLSTYIVSSFRESKCKALTSLLICCSLL